jgi:uncharacterized membrane protein YcfT
MADGTDGGRIPWVDTAKGICIIMVVMVHAALGVEEAAGETGWLGLAVTYARPFRMPDFFLISGLFLALVIDRPWRRYLDRKVVHFAYFYVLWLTIQFAFKAPGMAMEEGALAPAENYLFAFVQPFGTLWFVYLLPIFFVVARVLKPLPAWMVLGWAAVLEILPVHTGSIIVDEFCARFVWFYAGYALAPQIFRFAAWVRANPGKTFAAIAVWAPVNGLLAFTTCPEHIAPWLQPDIGTSGAIGGLAELPFVSLLLAIPGIGVVIAVASLVAGAPWSRWLTWLGSHSIVVYLAFFLPMAVTRTVLLKLGIFEDVGTISFITWVAAVVGPVVLYGLVQWSGWGRWLFERPGWAHVDRPARKEAVQPAE